MYVVNVCDNCGIKVQVIKNEECVKFFLEYLLELKKTFKKVIVIAHNGQAFDHQFILNYILTSTNIKPKLIMRGTKIILMMIHDIKFIDSLNYFPMPLASLPKAFDLQTVTKKGIFSSPL